MGWDATRIGRHMVPVQTADGHRDNHRGEHGEDKSRLQSSGEHTPSVDILLEHATPELKCPHEKEMPVGCGLLDGSTALKVALETPCSWAKCLTAGFRARLGMSAWDQTTYCSTKSRSRKSRGLHAHPRQMEVEEQGPEWLKVERTVPDKGGLWTSGSRAGRSR